VADIACWELSDVHLFDSQIIAEITDLKSCESCHKQKSISRRSCNSSSEARYLERALNRSCTVSASSGASPNREKINKKVI
jgi:hypothetical protein